MGAALAGWPGESLPRGMFGCRLEWGEAGSHVRMGGESIPSMRKSSGRGPAWDLVALENRRGS